jgi:hypothetical protein
LFGGVFDALARLGTDARIAVERARRGRFVNLGFPGNFGESDGFHWRS